MQKESFNFFNVYYLFILFAINTPRKPPNNPPINVMATPSVENPAPAPAPGPHAAATDIIVINAMLIVVVISNFLVLFILSILCFVNYFSMFSIITLYDIVFKVFYYLRFFISLIIALEGIKIKLKLFSVTI